MKIVFCDRDGVINRYPGHKKYVTSVRGFRFLKGSREGIALLTRAGFRVHVVSNQAGVSKGLYSKATLTAMTRKMREGVRRAGGRLAGVHYCLHTSEMDCACRKPKTGLLKQAVHGQRLDLDHTYFIGDSLLDVKAGRAFGAKTILVLTGREKRKNASSWDVQPDFVAVSLYQAARRIMAGKYQRA
jgi:D-glycero-D-manno-heptose 1,7-bisphosphate phosphatase